MLSREAAHTLFRYGNAFLDDTPKMCLTHFLGDLECVFEAGRGEQERREAVGTLVCGGAAIRSVTLFTFAG